MEYWLKKFINVLRNTEFNKTISTFTIPGMIILIGSLYLGVQTLHIFLMEGSLLFGPTMLLIILIVVGTFMVLIGILLDFLSFDRES